MKQFVQWYKLGRSCGFIFATKYKLGFAKEHKDFY